MRIATFSFIQCQVANTRWNSQLLASCILHCCYVLVQHRLTRMTHVWFLYLVYSPFTAGRYHSLVIEKESFPSGVLEITAWTEDGLIMAARHKVHRHIQVTLLVSLFSPHGIEEKSLLAVPYFLVSSRHGNAYSACYANLLYLPFDGKIWTARRER